MDHIASVDIKTTKTKMKELLDILIKKQETLPFDITINNKKKFILIEYGKDRDEEQLESDNSK